MSKKLERFETYLARHRTHEAETAPPASRSRESQPPPGPELEKFSLSEAFDYFNISDDDRDPSISSMNLERAIRAVAFLLEWLSQHGNESVDGFTAHGLAQILDRCADKVASFNPKGGN